MLSKSQLYFQFSHRSIKFVQIQPLFVLIFSVSVIFDINWENNGGLEQIWRAYVKIENIAEIYSAQMDSRIYSKYKDRNDSFQMIVYYVRIASVLS